MLKVKKKTTYGAIPKNNELIKLTSESKQAIQKIEEEKNKKNPQKINDYAKLIQSIKKEYQKLALENQIFKKVKKRSRSLLTQQITTENNKSFSKEKKEKDI